MADDQEFFLSRFAQWSAEQLSANNERLPALREHALRMLIESVKQGEIGSIDGIDSPLSVRIMAHHGNYHF
jgi:hypothetical protein